jgi:uncharacterized membrane protein YdjX (TVP38/TMEM64 family)
VRPIFLRATLILLLAAGTIGAFAWQGAVDPRRIGDLVGSSASAPALYILLSIASAVFFVPRTIFAAAAGLLFGFWWGVLWATIGSTGGAILGFLLARYLGKGLADKAKWPLVAPAVRAAEHGGWRTIALIRLIPFLPNGLVNYGLGITRVGLPSYTIGSLLGMLPMTIVCAELGAGGNLALNGGSWVGPTVAALALLVLTMVLPRIPLLRRSLRFGAE